MPDRDLLFCQRLKKWDYSIHVPVSREKKNKQQQKRTIKDSEKINSNTKVSTTSHTQLYINTLETWRLCQQLLWRRHTLTVGIPSLFMAHSIPLLFTDASNLHRGSCGLATLARHNTPYWMLTTTDGYNRKYLWTCYSAG